MRTIEDKKFSKVACDSWGSAPNLRHGGGATRNVATWRILIEGINGMTLGFPAIFQFPWIFGFKNFLFLYFNFCSECYLSLLSLRLLRFCSGDSDLAPAISFEFFWFQSFILQGTFLFSSSSIPLSFIIFYEFLILSLPFALLLLCLIFGFLGFYSPFHGQFFWS